MIYLEIIFIQIIETISIGICELCIIYLSSWKPTLDARKTSMAYCARGNLPFYSQTSFLFSEKPSPKQRHLTSSVLCLKTWSGHIRKHETARQKQYCCQLCRLSKINYVGSNHLPTFCQTLFGHVKYKLVEIPNNIENWSLLSHFWNVIVQFHNIIMYFWFKFP